jgi:hypothetical protein
MILLFKNFNYFSLIIRFILKKIVSIFVLTSIFCWGCKKEQGWDTLLNGTWTEVSNNNTRALPSNCDIVFQDGTMILCDESLGADLNNKSRIYANEGQIWISYKLSFRKHEEYRYDYQFEGEYLWLVEETSEHLTTAINNSNAKKYRRK